MAGRWFTDLQALCAVSNRTVFFVHAPSINQSINQSFNQSKIVVVATDTARTTMKSYWRKSREGETTQVKFKLNAVNDEAEVTCSGSVFQMRAPATGNAREPTEVSRTTGTIRSSVVEDLAWFQGAASRQGR